jgi:TetR/AcrR family transcriptional regulator
MNEFSQWIDFPSFLQQLEAKGLASRTFRRLEPERQQAIINAVLEEAFEKGPASLNIKEVARRADVAVGSLYQYFPNRDGLLDFSVELCSLFMSSLFDLTRTYLAEMPLADALRAYLSVGIDWGQSETGFVRFFGRAAYQGDPQLAEKMVRPVAETMRKTVSVMLQQAAARGEINPDQDLEAAARLINGLTIVVGDSQLLPYLNTYFQITDDEVSPQRILDALVPFILKGLS